MIALTTGQCADMLNELVGMEAYSADFIRAAILNGLIKARISKGSRRRAYIRIMPADFRAYVRAEHADLLAEFDIRWHAQQRDGEIAS